MIDDILSLNPTRKRFISIIYDKLVEIRQAPLDKIKKAWEHDLNTSLSNSEWESIFKLINTSSLWARHRLLQFKVVHRAHWSKVRLSSIYPNVDPHCDKSLSDEASLIHMFWTCPSLENFWKEVFRTLLVILKIDLKPNPLVAIFGATGGASTHFSPTQRRVLSFTSLLARRAVLVRWRDAAPPTHTQWFRDVMSCLTLEKIRYSISNYDKKFLTVWGPFLNYFHHFQLS